MRGHLATLSSHVTSSGLPSDRLRLHRAIADAASFLAALERRLDHQQQAAHHFQVAEEHARGRRPPAARAGARVQELPGLDDAKRGLRGDTRAALALLEEANAIVPAHTFPPARAGLAAQLAEEHAAAGDADRCERALDAAASILAEANGDSSTTGFFSEQGNYAFWNETLLEGFRGICAVLLKAPKAVDVLTRALAQATTIERRVTVGTDLAAAHLHAGAPEVAAGELSEAYTLAITFGFPMGVQRILGVRAQLAPWSRLQEVRELDEQLRGLLAPGAPKGAARIRG